MIIWNLISLLEVALWSPVTVVCTDETMVINVFCGVVSGVMSSCLANPTDVLKVNLTTSGSVSSSSASNISEQTGKVKSADLKFVCMFMLFQIRMQAQGSLLQGSMMSNFINIYQTEGTRGLWRVSCSAVWLSAAATGGRCFTIFKPVFVHIHRWKWLKTVIQALESVNDGFFILLLIRASFPQPSVPP